MATQGWQGWDDYAAFYDWENLRTFGRRDVVFWRGLATRERGPALELGCGTGRVLIPVARTGIALTGIDRSTPMLDRARARARRLPSACRPLMVRGDIRALPFPRAWFGLVMAPYGMLQSLLSDGDLDRTLAEAVRVLRRGGMLAVDLVPDLPAWAEDGRRVRLRGAGPGGATVTLVEAVRQDRRRRLTVFDEEFVERRGRRERRRRFTLTFRTLAIDDILARIERAGCQIEMVLGDYRGGPWHERANVWMILGRKRTTLRADPSAAKIRTKRGDTAMSGHSKWHTIKHKKGAADAKRGKIFTRLIKELTVAARAGGGDPDMNPRLRTIIADAKAANMPAENIKRAIRRGTGEEEGVTYDEVTYEGYGPGGVAILVETLTDNRNRTVGEIRHTFTKYGGNLGEANSVGWMFEKKSLITVDKGKTSEEALMAAVLDAGADDMKDDGSAWEIVSALDKHQAVVDAVKALGIDPDNAEIAMLPQSYIKLEGKQAQQMLKLVEAFEDHDDTRNVWSNFDVDEKEIEASLA